ncbi:hypothetical protein MMC08_003272 [Hypocenomyce scalaris]|nr:hypothetical protein [Hypocenomyce scalaris]
MALPLNPVKLVLFILSIAGFYGTWVLLMNNGTAEQMAHIRDHGPHWLPGTKEPPRRLYIGIAPIDYQLTILAVFFWKVVDGSMPNGSLLAFHLAGQFGAAWTIVVLEGLRKGHRGRVIS